MSTNQQYLQVPSTYDGPSDTRSQGSPGRSSQHGGSQHGGSQRIGTPAQSPARSQGGGSHMSPGGGSRSRAESGASSGRPRGESGAQRAPSGNPSPFPPGTGRDPALEPGRRPQGMNTRIDLPPEAFVQVSHSQFSWYRTLANIIYRIHARLLLHAARSSVMWVDRS